MSVSPETGSSANVNEAKAPAGGELTARARARTAEAGKGVQLSEVAARQIRQIIDKDGYPETMYLFVGVKGGGCSGLQYVLDLRDEAMAPVSDKDEVYLSHDIVVVVDLKSYIVGNLEGTTIDYQESLMGAGFTFNNPNAKHSCGCGSSYSA